MISLSSKLSGLALLVLLSGCDKQTTGDPLPATKGEGAPAELALPKAGNDTGTHAASTSQHRWIGSAKAKHHVELAPEMGGTITSIEVEEGDKVTKGQLLFKVEGSEIKLSVAQAAAAVVSAEVQVSEAQREADRTSKLAAKGSVGSANLERAQGGVDAAEAGLKQAKAAAALARSRIADLTVESPIDGLVTAKLKSVGEMATTMPPTIVLVIEDLSTIEVRVRVPELKLRELDVGTQVTVHFPALDHDVTVPITRIGNSVDPRTRTIELIIDVPNPDLRIKGGMSVEVEIAKSEPVGSSASEAKPDEPEKPVAEANAPAPTAMAEQPAAQPSKG